MPSWLNKLIHGVAIAGQMANLGFVPQEVTPYVATGLAMAQAVAGVLVHHYNPDGTPATIAYVKKGKK